MFCRTFTSFSASDRMWRAIILLFCLPSHRLSHALDCCVSLSLSSRYTKGIEQSIFWVTAISKEVCFVLFLAGFPELVRGAFSAPPVGHQSPRTIRLPSIQAATTVFSGGAPDAGAARLPLQPGRLPSGLMCAFVIARATHTLLDLARCLISALYAP